MMKLALQLENLLFYRRLCSFWLLVL